VELRARVFWLHNALVKLSGNMLQPSTDVVGIIFKRSHTHKQTYGRWTVVVFFAP